MGLFLNAAAAVTPTESAVEKNLLHCEGLNNQTYICESGHCCGESQCCSYYYELWWFWLVWALIFILSCCCVCHHRRTKHRLQQQQRQHEINLIAYREAHNYTSVPFYFRFLPSYLLPDYEEVVNRPPTPPPPYSASSHSGPSTVASSPQVPEQQEGLCPVLQSTPAPQVSEGLCSTPSMEDLELLSLDFRPKPETKSMQTAQDSGVILLPDVLQEELVNQLKGSGNDHNTSKDPLLKDFGLSECCAEDKDRLRGGRRRRFTGDSGIEVCVCSTRGSSSCSGAGGPGQDGREFRELESLLSHEGDEQEGEESGNFCESCSHRASFVEEEQVTASLERQPTQGQSGSPPTAQRVSAPPHLPVCLLLQTISEQEGVHQSTSTEPQG
ncbi:LOW QUALITY PROTEIN: WW domain binding protein 1-like b [Thalassophryne amazonica]|uniref:LOW QUALITY PROTEIN: WW domain binding protein 1-like b n=1 Tax=Thalassophryne amazonica TaxID=390379 RepID=UPI00147202BE|nr:LOW QUALITY PROTEIN: WW domain binding protein 1-like b [Thalassophryne amazonica]